MDIDDSGLMVLVFSRLTWRSSPVSFPRLLDKSKQSRQKITKFLLLNSLQVVAADDEAAIPRETVGRTKKPQGETDEKH